MTEAIRTFCVGDSVIALCRLEGPVDVPSGSRGTVVRVWLHPGPRPYAVIFETDGADTVRLNVEEHQIGRVASHGPIAAVPMPDPVMPTVTTCKPRRHIDRQALYKPTADHPHYQCVPLHLLQLALMSLLYICLLWMIPQVVLMLTGVVVLSGYLHQLTIVKRWALVPVIFKSPYWELNGEVKVTVDAGHVQSAHRADVLQVLSISMLLAYHFANVSTGFRNSVAPYVILGAITFLFGMIKSIEHGKAVTVTLLTDDGDA